MPFSLTTGTPKNALPLFLAFLKVSVTSWKYYKESKQRAMLIFTA